MKKSSDSFGKEQRVNMNEIPIYEEHSDTKSSLMFLPLEMLSL